MTAVRPQDLDTLGFPQLLDELARHASSSAGRGACRQLSPQFELAPVREELARITDMMAVMEEDSVPLGDFPDIRSFVAHARTLGARLKGAELLRIAETLSDIRRMRGYLRAKATGRPRLLRSLGLLHSLPELDQRLATALDEDGNLRDSASPALRAVRRELRLLRSEIEARLGRLFRQSSSSQAFADEYVTVRNGRFVVPVRSQAQSQIPGIVQDRSSSGETLFVEPLFAVESNNRLLIAAREEAAEEVRIFTELTEMIGRNADALSEAFAALVDLDTVVARVKFARSHDAVCPQIGEPGNAILLREARHPLLVLTRRPVTPVHLELDLDCRLLILTGPNTGGKSVALKTLGLATLMAQSGIPVLCEGGGTLPLFDGVWTDIGDQQDVADDLSTFSGHVRNLGEIFANSSADSLVLLDEPGTGTDPEDGAALARTLLEELVRRGTRVLATTHFQAVKLFALNSAGAKVAAVDFDPETFAPLYRLIYGSIGPSLGLAMARRLGLPADLLESAEQRRGALAEDVGGAITRLESERRHYEESRAQLAHERVELNRLQGENRALQAELREKKRKKWAQELSEAKRFAEELRSEGKRLLAEARQHPQRVAHQVHRAGLEQSARIEAKQRSVLDPAVEESSSPPDALIPGQEVEVLGSGVRGKLLQVTGDRARIEQGAIRFDVPTKQLRVTGNTPAGTQKPPRTSHRLERTEEEDSSSESFEINLVGTRVPRALERLESFLDRAALGDRTFVRIIHGHGTGALRSAVREYLADSPYVTRYEESEGPTGGTGATIAHLR